MRKLSKIATGAPPTLDISLHCANTRFVPISEVASAKTVTDAFGTRQSYAQSICLRRQAGDHAAFAFVFAVASLGAFTGPFALTKAA
jgi:hypothetical protein